MTKNNSSYKIEVKNLNLYYSSAQALHNISFKIKKQTVTAFIGPSGCGKSSLLRCLNRMNDEVEGSKVTGSVLLDSTDIYSPQVNVVSLRLAVGMVFQKPVPFPGSIYHNVSFGLKVHQLSKSKAETDFIVEESLTKAGLWNEVKDRLQKSAFELSGGQQQRLCIARTIALKPDVILMDEPTSALDPIATKKVEELIREISQNYTIVIVTHSMQQAARISDNTAFFYMGKMIECDETSKIFTNPKETLTQDYITGRMG
jgi:phosphate transport system ATP-binding protein